MSSSASNRRIRTCVPAFTCLLEHEYPGLIQISIWIIHFFFIRYGVYEDGETSREASDTDKYNGKVLV